MRYTLPMKRGIATFTLDYGKCPKWLFDRMVLLGREIVDIMVQEYGPDEVVKRLGDPVWFQSLGTVLAFDWNASGLTTILTAALKEAIRGREQELGLFICGGKGKTSLKTPDEIIQWSERSGIAEERSQALVYNSKMSAKVDSSLLQDGYAIYHHAFFFTKSGAWAVVQQGMDTKSQTARRYHWFSADVQDLIREPHSGIMAQKKVHTLDMTANASEASRDMSVELANDSFFALMKDIRLLRKYSTKLNQMVSLELESETLTLLNLENTEFKTHPVVNEDFSRSKYLEKILYLVTQTKPKTYEEFVAMKGVGPKTVRALSLVGEIIYGAKPSYEDPSRYSFAHGGKDYTPYPVDRPTYDQTIDTLAKAVEKSHINPSEKAKVLNRLYKKEKE